MKPEVVFAQWKPLRGEWERKGTAWSACGIQLLDALGAALDRIAALEAEVERLRNAITVAIVALAAWHEMGEDQADDLREMLEAALAKEQGWLLSDGHRAGHG